MAREFRLERARQQRERLIEPPGRRVADQRDIGRQTEIDHVEHLELAAVRAVRELPARDETQSAALRQQRELEVFAEDLGGDADRQLLAIERLGQRGAAAAAGWIEEPGLGRKIAQPPRLAVTFAPRPRGRDDDDL